MVDNADVLERLTQIYGEPIKSNKASGSGPAEYWDFPGFKGSIGFISAISHSFCDACNRVRLTADGILKPCLCYQDGLNLKPHLRGCVSDATLKEAIENVIQIKPLRHNFCGAQGGNSENRKMVQIGG
jgi:cyclic pyranopterin phosphate synthase